MNCRNTFLALSKDRYFWLKKSHGPGSKDRSRESLLSVLLGNFAPANLTIGLSIFAISLGYFGATLSLSNLGIPIWMVSKEDVIYIGVTILFLIAPSLLSIISLLSLFSRQKGGVFRFCPVPLQIFSCLIAILAIHIAFLLFGILFGLFEISLPLVVTYYLASSKYFALIFLLDITLWSLGALLWLPRRRRRRWGWGWGWRHAKNSSIIRLLKQPNSLASNGLLFMFFLFFIFSSLIVKLDQLVSTEYFYTRTGVRNTSAIVKTNDQERSVILIYFSNGWLVAKSPFSEEKYYIPSSSVKEIIVSNAKNKLPDSAKDTTGAN
jgi:hypothetical protein